MGDEPKTPVEHAEEAVRKAEEEFARNPNDATEAHLFGMRNWFESMKELAAKDPGFNIRPPKKP
jgi:hypothetical protein